MAMYYVLVFLLCISAIPAEAVSLENGKKVYLQRCTECHGDTGEGDGQASKDLPRKPRDFTEGIYKIKSSVPTDLIPLDKDIFMTIYQGMPPSGMPPWKDILTDDDIWDVVAYIKNMSDVFEEEPAPTPLDLSGKILYSERSANLGRSAYTKLRCYECHGDTGQGPSTKELKDDYGRIIKPRNLTKPWLFIGPYTEDGIYARITNGIPLTPMPAFRDFGKVDSFEKDRWNIVNYLIKIKNDAEEERRRNMMIGSIAGFLILLVLVGGYFLKRKRR